MIHRYWTGPDEPEIQYLSDQRIWHDEDIPYEIAAWMDAREHLVVPEDIPRHRSNMLRWWLLWEHGGTYLDHDFVLMMPIPPGPWIMTPGLSQDICVGAVSTNRHDPFTLEVLEAIGPAAKNTSPWVSGSLHVWNLRCPYRRVPLHHLGTHEWVTSTLRRQELEGRISNNNLH